VASRGHLAVNPIGYSDGRGGAVGKPVLRDTFGRGLGQVEEEPPRRGFCLGALGSRSCIPITHGVLPNLAWKRNWGQRQRVERDSLLVMFGTHGMGWLQDILRFC